MNFYQFQTHNAKPCRGGIDLLDLDLAGVLQQPVDRTAAHVLGDRRW